MNLDWLDKYLDFYQAKLEKVTSADGITVHKLTGQKSKKTIEISINLNTLYHVLQVQLKDEKVFLHLNKPQDILFVNSDNLELINEIQTKYGGSVHTGLLKYEHTLQIYKYVLNQDNKTSASI